MNKHHAGDSAVRPAAEYGVLGEVELAVLEAARVSAVVLGRLKLHPPTVVDARVALQAGSQMNRHAAVNVVVEAFAMGDATFDTSFQRPDPTATTLGGASRPSDVYAWLITRRGLVGIANPAADGATVVGLVSDDDVEDFTRSQRDIARIVLKHEEERRRWASKAAPASAETEVLAALFQQLRCAAVIVTGDGEVLFHNRAAEAAFSEANPVSLLRRRLTARDTPLRERLAAALQRAARPGLRAPTVLNAEDDHNGERQLVVVAPLPTNERPLVVVARQLEPREDPIVDATLRALGLTPAEARLAQQLLLGHSTCDAAKRAHIAESTARSYLKRIFYKTGARRQSELVALIMALIPQICIAPADQARTSALA